MTRPFRPVTPLLFWFCFGIALMALVCWCGAEAEQGCKAKHGDHLVSTGRTWLCVTKDGRIIE